MKKHKLCISKLGVWVVLAVVAIVHIFLMALNSVIEM